MIQININCKTQNPKYRHILCLKVAKEKVKITINSKEPQCPHASCLSGIAPSINSLKSISFNKQGREKDGRFLDSTRQSLA